MTGPPIDAQVDMAMRKTQGLFAKIHAQQNRWLRPSALAFVAETRKTLSTPGRGRFYKSRGIKSRLRGKGTKGRAVQLHRASVPGDPPAPDIGELRRTIGIEELPSGGFRMGSPLRQAAPLEFGTLGTGRPSLRFRRGPTAPNRKALLARLKRSGASRSSIQSLAQKGSRRLAARPFLRPSLDRAIPKMTALAIAELERFTQNELRTG